MGSPEFAAFSIVTLASTLTVGAARAAIFQPALIQQRINSSASVPCRFAVLASSGALVVIALVSQLTVGLPSPEALLVGATLALPVAYDWARYRSMGSSRRWRIVLADGVRILVVLVSVSPAATPTIPAFCMLIAASCLCGMTVLLWKVPIRLPYYGYRTYGRSALWQSIDYVVGQLVVSAPMFVLASAGAGQLISGVRLAQTLLGPLNLAFSAATTNLVADGSTSAALRSAEAMIRQGWRASAKLAGLAAGLVTGMIAIVVFTPLTLTGVAREDLVLGILLVGGATVFTGWSGIHGIVLRVLNHQAAVTWARIGIAVLTSVGFLGGYLLGGERLSLTLGFLMNGLAAPAVFLPVAMHYYRRDREAEAGS